MIDHFSSISYYLVCQILEDVIKQEGFCHMESRTDITDGYHMTPLLCAVKGNAVETFNILISNGADISAKDLNGHGVAEVAIICASIDVFEHLLVHRLHLQMIDFKKFSNMRLEVKSS